MAVVQYFLGFEMSKNSVSDEKHLLRTQLRQTAAVSHRQKGNKCHAWGEISDTVCATVIQLFWLVTPTHASEYKITFLLPTPHLLKLPLCSLLLTAPFSADSSFKCTPLLLQPSPRKPLSPEAALSALPLQFGGTTQPFLHFTGTSG